MFESNNKNNSKLVKKVGEESKKSLKDHTEYYSSAELKIISPVVVKDGQAIF